ncbi:mCG1043791 [Mus musculus]|nr:mCG1043791 [Mus musculus]
MDKKMDKTPPWLPKQRLTLGKQQSEQAVNGPALQGSIQQVGVWSCGRLAILSRTGWLLGHCAGRSTLATPLLFVRALVIQGSRGSKRVMWPLLLCPLSSSLQF